MSQILKFSLLDEMLLEKGYVVVPFLNEGEVARLTNNYFEHHVISHEGMYASAHVPDLDFRKKMNEHIKGVFARAIDHYFQDCNPLGGSFVVKGKSQKGTINPHQDWNIVDEDKFRSFNIWVPLVDLNETNGAIRVMPESHNWFRTFRSANISSAYESVCDLLWEKMQTLTMRKGEALIYDHRLLHASGENFTDQLRLAAVFGIIPNGSEMFYYHQQDNETVEIFESNPDFFMLGNIFEGPKGLKSIGTTPYSQNWSKQELEAKILGIPYNSPVTKPENFWGRIKRAFS